MSARHRTSSADVADVILSTAATLLEEEGPEALSIRHLCAAAGVAPMGVYNHFSSKAGVIDALFEQSFNRLADALEVVHHLADDEEALRAGLAVYRALALEHPASYRLMMAGAGLSHAPSVEAATSADRAFGQLVRGVVRMMDAGRFARADPQEIAQRIWASCHGWISLELAEIGFVDDTSAGYEGLVDLLIAGLRPLG